MPPATAPRWPSSACGWRSATAIPGRCSSCWTGGGARRWSCRSPPVVAAPIPMRPIDRGPGRAAGGGGQAGARRRRGRGSGARPAGDRRARSASPDPGPPGHRRSAADPPTPRPGALHARLGSGHLLVYFELDGRLGAATMHDGRAALVDLGVTRQQVDSLIGGALFALRRLARPGTPEPSLLAAQASLEDALARLDGALLGPLSSPAHRTTTALPSSSARPARSTRCRGRPCHRATGGPSPSCRH